MEVTVHIKGARASGRTTLAKYLKDHLLSLGVTVHLYATEDNGTEVLGVATKDTFVFPAAIKPEGIVPKTVGSNMITAIEEATLVIYGDREKTYGDPGKNLRVIAEYWYTHLKAKYDYKGGLTTDDVCVMMVLLKQARLANSPKHRDSIVDTIGYSALADRINVAEQEADERAAAITEFSASNIK